MKKILLSIVCCLLVLSGCASPEKIKTITIPEFKEKIKNKDSFVVMVSRPSCEHCQLMKEMLDETTKDHDTIIYNIVLNEESYDILVGDVKKLEPYLSEPGTTPHVYYVREGKEIDSFEGFDEDRPDQFWEFIKKYNLEDAK